MRETVCTLHLLFARCSPCCQTGRFSLKSRATMRANRSHKGVPDHGVQLYPGAKLVAAAVHALFGTIWRTPDDQILLMVIR